MYHALMLIYGVHFNRNVALRDHCIGTLYARQLLPITWILNYGRCSVCF